METSGVSESLWDIVERFSVPKPMSLMGTASPPFDISKPNFHDSKADFLQEKRDIGSALASAKPLLELMLKGVSNASGPEHDVIRNVLKVVDAQVRSKRRDDRLESVFDLTRWNAARIGLSVNLVFLLFDLVDSLQEREQELENQEVIFWNSVGRAPNHYARTIALRLAQLIARSTGKKPTFGTARDGGHPSTDFGRALEEIFKVLGIGADVRNAARWAIGQLTDEDLKPMHGNTLAELLYGDTSGLTFRPTPGAELLRAMMGKGA